LAYGDAARTVFPKGSRAARVVSPAAEGAAGPAAGVPGGPRSAVLSCATMRPLLLGVFCLIAAISRCDSPDPRLPPPDPRPGDFVRIRGTLDEDVDCRLLRAEDGKVYSLSQRLPRLANGSRVCVHGTLASVSQCLHQPTIEVDEIRNWNSCP